MPWIMESGLWKDCLSSRVSPHKFFFGTQGGSDKKTGARGFFVDGSLVHPLVFPFFFQGKAVV